MIQIRNGVFETNSSSSHSLVVKTEGRVLTPEEIAESMYISGNGSVRIYDNSFGRSPFQVLSQPLDKLAYVLAEYSKTDQFQSILDRFIEYVPGLKKIDFPNEINWRTDKVEVYYGDIDHQSAGMLKRAIFEEQIDPLDIVFNTRYVIIVDGDEYDEFGSMFRSGLINMNKIKTIYPFPYTTKEGDIE